MNKQNKSLLLIAVVLTFLTLAIWGIFFSSSYNDSNPSQPLLPHTNKQHKGVDLNEFGAFGLKFDELAVSQEGEVIDIPIALNGNTSEIVSSQVVISYNPRDIQVEEIIEGDLFDFYVGKIIDNENGKVYLSGALTETINKNTATFANLKFYRTSDNPTTIKILGSNDQSDNIKQSLSKVITILGHDYFIKSDVFSLPELN